jgi:hypothetical protein
MINDDKFPSFSSYSKEKEEGKPPFRHCLKCCDHGLKSNGH